MTPHSCQSRLANELTRAGADHLGADPALLEAVRTRAAGPGLFRLAEHSAAWPDTGAAALDRLPPP